MENNIQLISIAEILDGRTFYIPSYQRGYRWTTKEVTDLLNDLYSFTIRGKKNDGEFYCLQPIIVQRIEDETIISTILDGIDSSSRDVWEVIDGQQRLTSILILYKYLLEKKGWDKERLKEDEDKELFHIRYETRDDSAAFLENLQKDTLSDTYIDFSHISDAYRIIDAWVKDDAKRISERYHRSSSVGSVCDALFRLLNCGREAEREDCGSAQFIWYELASDGSESSKQKAISEFLKINTGKIELTDAELIKALFLQKKNFISSERESRQLEIAMQWEGIENTLHKDDFWYFISSKRSRPNRIDEIFELIYKTDGVKEFHEKVVDQNISQRKSQLTEKNRIFRYYYQKFDGLQGEALQVAIKKEWDKVILVFRTLEDWYEDPKMYNYVGFLSQCGIDIAKLYIKYFSLPESATKHEIEGFFVEQIKKQLEGIKIGLVNLEEEGVLRQEYRINAQYGKDNWAILFPFDVFVSQNWNIEHIDSYTTNALMSSQEQKDWVDNAMKEIRDVPDKNGTKQRIDAFYQLEKYKEIIPLIQEIVEEDADEDQKNSIGNLTLLDEKTNKSYGNSLFCQKNRIIQERITRGTFVPTSTSMVFNKAFDTSTNKNFFKWGADDKRAYHNYIFNELKTFLTFNEKDIQLL